ncbi:MAG: response regulator [Bdellovibrionales bacterium]|nr:response regulator [Bdellovibrionales bacterium]
MLNLSMKVLIVDDMMTMRKLVKKTLNTMGFSVIEEAADGVLGWAKLNENPDVGLIISDWNMPNCTGLDLLKRVRADSKFKDLPFILLTAEGEVHQVKEAMAAKVDSYVLKPFTFESLKEKLEQTFKKRAAA